MQVGTTSFDFPSSDKTSSPTIVLRQSILLNFTLRSFSNSCCLILNNLEKNYYQAAGRHTGGVLLGLIAKELRFRLQAPTPFPETTRLPGDHIDQAIILLKTV